MTAYYNEIDPFAAAWLRELIKEKQIADGEVDERSIADVTADDVRGFVQCHWFAGIGGWSYALRLAGWDDSRACWTGSPPCQPFSSAGAQAGGNDPRDLWPAWFKLIAECRPVVVFGEQVESAIGHGWLDRLCDDLEAEDYAVGACGLPAASAGAFHIRQRLWFVADASGERAGRDAGTGASAETQGACERIAVGDNAGNGAQSCRAVGLVADTKHAERRPLSVDREDERDGHDAGWPETHGEPGARREVRELADTDGQRRARERVLLRADATGRDAAEVQQAAGRGGAGGVGDSTRGGQRIHGRASGDAGHVDESDADGELGKSSDARLEGLAGDGDDGHESGRHDARAERSTPAAGVSHFWSDVDWIHCRDGKARPVRPGSFPLAARVPARVGRLRGYGNAIVPQVAQAFIEAYCEARITP